MAGPITASLRAIRRAREPNDVFSLALIPTNGGYPVQGNAQIWSAYVENPTYTACHDVADELSSNVFQPNRGNAAIAVGNGQGAVNVAAAHFAPNHLLRVDYGAHSFTLTNTGGTVECFEAWAHQTNPYTIGTCLIRTNEAERIDITAADVQREIPNLLSPAQDTRRTAADTLSRAGLGGFGNVNNVPTLRISAFPLANALTISTRYRALIDTAKEWAQGAVQAYRHRYTCSECLDYHGWTRSWRNNTWAECNTCGFIYCPSCKARLINFVFAGAIAKRCICNHSVDDIDWKKIGP